jgi:hypothetical protein
VARRTVEKSTKSVYTALHHAYLFKKQICRNVFGMPLEEVAVSGRACSVGGTAGTLALRSNWTVQGWLLVTLTADTYRDIAVIFYLLNVGTKLPHIRQLLSSSASITMRTGRNWFYLNTC